jgi:hypothetical protein
MRKLLLAVMVVLAMAGTVSAAHLVCDPPPAPLPDSYVFTGMPAPLTNTATGASVKADGSLYLDVSTMPTGSYSITVKACKTDPVWGQACSATVPFTLVRPALVAPVLPGHINIVP